MGEKQLKNILGVYKSFFYAAILFTYIFFALVPPSTINPLTIHECYPTEALWFCMLDPLYLLLVVNQVTKNWVLESSRLCILFLIIESTEVIKPCGCKRAHV